MVATFDIQLDTGGTADNPGASEVVTNIRFNAEDTNDQDLASPIVIPNSGTEYSFWKHIYLHCTNAPDTQVYNVKLYTDGALGWGTGVTVYIADETPTNNSGASTGYDTATTQQDITNHADVTAKTDLFTFTSGSPKTVSISETSNIIDALNEETDYIILYVEVASTAVQGTKSTETVTWQYDEI